MGVIYHMQMSLMLKSWGVKLFLSKVRFPLSICRDGMASNSVFHVASKRSSSRTQGVLPASKNVKHVGLSSHSCYKTTVFLDSTYPIVASKMSFLLAQRSIACSKNVKHRGLPLSEHIAAGSLQLYRTWLTPGFRDILNDCTFLALGVGSFTNNNDVIWLTNS